MGDKILFLDDESNILSSLKRLLRKEPYEIILCSRGEEAIEILENTQVSVIVTDMRMPEMNGVEFLLKAMKIQPDSTKIILSGYGDINDIMKAVNEGNVDSYIQKPWNDEALKIRLRNGCAAYASKEREKKLLLQLAKKNKQLNNMNHELESLVRQRTIELEERNRILKMIVDGSSNDQILNQTCLGLQKTLKLESVNLMEVKTGNFYPNGQKPPEEILHRQEIGKNIIVKDYLCYQLEENKRLFGYLYLHPIGSLSNEKKRSISHFSALIEMILLQQNYLEKSDLIVDSIDSILGELNGHKE